jgi:hypothetical protein
MFIKQALASLAPFRKLHFARSDKPLLFPKKNCTSQQKDVPNLPSARKKDEISCVTKVL